jgi:hypothetical protein
MTTHGSRHSFEPAGLAHEDVTADGGESVVPPS